jgi:serine/threonine-protein kinase
MAHCPSCGSEISQGKRFCGDCGAAVDPSSAPTETSLKSEQPATSHPTPDQARFIPGTVLAKRYRIVGLLGRGGMGEVYRADDLKLGQPVALKFLPRAVDQDKNRLDRFLNEVKTALRVTHPNVCRVYDVGEVDGQHFLSMEYVDGEDLASLLRRIGRLPGDKAVQVARQLCAGLAAAHDQGILHRDLKPANVMIDGRGRAKITDFGLANLAGMIEGEEVRAGTPSYMAPEQLAGREVTVKSDIYALGLLLYELFTGRRAFEARNARELARLQQTSEPTSPSSHVSELDPAVERIVLRCLDREPGRRPAGALAVSAALPGGDPLAAALAAGETPSPEMVADARGAGGLKPAWGALSLVLIILGLVAMAGLSGLDDVPGRVALDKPPEALAVTARDMVEQAGYRERPADRAYGFEYDRSYFEFVRSQDPSPEQWDRLASIRPAPIFFWYRQSPDYLVAADFFGDGSPFIRRESPPWDTPGMVGVRLDPQGRLLGFRAVPPATDSSARAFRPLDWSHLLVSAGLDPDQLIAAEPERNPLLDCDHRLAWEGSYPDQPDVMLRIEAGSYRGRVAYFEVVTPWMEESSASQGGAGSLAVNIFFCTLLLSIVVGGVVLARRNIRMGRGDRRGAFRLAAFLFAAQVIWWVLRADHVPAFSEFWLFFNFLGYGLVISGLAWLVYVAMEPFARRTWPKGMIAWNRLLAARLRDPLLGRDILIGALGGLAVELWWRFYPLLIDWLSLPANEPLTIDLTSLAGVRHALAMNVHNIVTSLYRPIGWLFIVLLLRPLLRKEWLAALVVTLVFAAVGTSQDPNVMVLLPFSILSIGLYFFLLLRVGLLSAIAASLFMFISQQVVLTMDMSSWYAGRSLFTLLLLAALAVYAFYISLGSRPLLGNEAPER